MKIEKLVAKNYKSLFQLSLPLKDFNVLIGRNNVGKSNILDCLSFLSELVIRPITQALSARGGYDHVVYGGNEEEKVHIEVIIRTGNERFGYMILFDKNKIVQERAWDVSSNSTLLDRGENAMVKFILFKGEPKEYTYSSSPVTSALMQFAMDPNLRLMSPILAQILDFLRDWRFYKLNPSYLRTALDPRREYDIGKDGKSMPLVLHTLVSSNLPIFKEIERTLRSALPEIEELQSPLEEDGTTHVAIKEKSFKDSFDHWQISDGTLSILAHLLIVFAPSKATLVCIEEPEDYVHPKLLKFLVDLLEASRTQILIVSHSPYLLDVVKPGNIFITRKIQGKTTCKTPRKRELAKFLKELSLGELWVSGGLEDV
jgi:predicted ATPase